MVSTQSVGGLVSGLDAGEIVPKLLAIESRPIQKLQEKIATATKEKEAYQQVSAQLLSLMIDAESLGDPDFFNTKKTNSTNSSIIDATATTEAILGSYIFTVGALAQNTQLMSSGYTAKTSTVGAGTISLEFSDRAHLNRVTTTDFFNGQQGFSRGKIQITDKNGSSATIDLTMAANAQEIIDAINSTTEIDVVASINANGNGFLIEDQSGGGGNLSIFEVSGGSTAESLGIKGSTAGASISGSNINYITANTELSMLNDGNGIRYAPAADISVTDTAAKTFNVDIDANDTTIQDVITKYNDAATAAGSTSRLSINAAGNGLVATDVTTLKGINDSQTALDLGLVDGGLIIGGLNDILLRNLNGGATLAADGVTVNGGVTRGDITITDRSGTTDTVNTTGLYTLNQVKDLISDHAGFDVTAKVNTVGNGLQIIDDTGLAVNPLIIAGAGAVSLGIDTAGATGNSYQGSDIDVKYISEATKLASLNGGEGIDSGSIKVTNTLGISKTFDLTSNTTIQSVLDEINFAGFGVTASINSTGDGIILNDTNGGATQMSVEEVGGGSTAQDLGLLGIADSGTPNILNGSLEKSITVNATDDLSAIVSKLNDLNMDISASIINDGSMSPYRLTIVGNKLGRGGELTVATDISGLTFGTTSKAADTKVLLGSAQAGGSPILTTKNSNTIDDIVEGLTLDVKSVSSSPVTISVTNDTNQVVSKVNSFVEHFNNVMQSIKDYTGYDAEAEEAGILLGDAALDNIKNDLFDMIINPVAGITSGINQLYDVGIKITDQGTIKLETSELEEKLSSDLDGVKNLFSQNANIARTDYNTYTSATSTDAAFSLNNAVNGNNNEADFGANNGWQSGAAGVFPQYYSIFFDQMRNLDSMKIFHVDSPALPFANFGINNFSIEYLNASNNWELFQQFENNTTTLNHVIFDNQVQTEAIRLKINGSNDGNFARLVEVEVYEKQGFAAQVKDTLDFLTDATDGTLTQQVSSIDERISDMEAQIEAKQELIKIKEEQLYREFIAMEQALSEMNSQMSYFQQQMAAM